MPLLTHWTLSVALLTRIASVKVPLIYQSMKKQRLFFSFFFFSLSIQAFILFFYSFPVFTFLFSFSFFSVSVCLSLFPLLIFFLFYTKSCSDCVSFRPPPPPSSTPIHRTPTLWPKPCLRLNRPTSRSSPLYSSCEGTSKSFLSSSHSAR